jgi:hypothetical protein
MKKLLALSRAAVSSLLLSLPGVAWAQGLRPVPPFQGTSGLPLLQAIIIIVNALLTFAALVAAIFIIYGGVRYIISRGDEDAAAEAKNTILYAVIGLIVIGLSAAIVNFAVGVIAGTPFG